MRLIDANALMEYCNNLKDKTIDANDIARFPTAVGWISVKDRMPEIRRAVLGRSPQYNNIWAVTVHDDGWYFWIPSHMKYEPDWYGPITHWMPIPEPPKEET